jgi:hypothetical protein
MPISLPLALKLLASTSLLIIALDALAVSAPATGVKNLYFGEFSGSSNNPVVPMPMSRIPLSTPTDPEYVRIRREDDDGHWQLTPALATSLEVGSGPIPVVLQMRRSGNSSTRVMRVSLDYLGAASGFIGCQTLAIPGNGSSGLSNKETRTFVFNVPRTDSNCNPVTDSVLTLPAGSILRAQVNNDPSLGPKGFAVLVYPFNNDSPDTSRVELPANTVINIDAIAVYAAPYPGGAVQPPYLPGNTVNVRAVVSDPFGSFDITGASVEVFDSSATLTTTANMLEVASSASSKTFEFNYTIPDTAPAGTWSARVTATEGTEGTITHSDVTTFLVDGGVADPGADIVVTKEVVAVSDPVTGTLRPKSIPGAVMEYVIRATNTGPSAVDADSVNIAEQLPAEVILLFGTPTNPITFADGPVPSGLSYSFVNLSDPDDDIAFSNDGGNTFITPSVDPGSGADLTSPPINYIEVTPKGQFNAPTTGDPSFTLTLQVLIR